RAEQARLERDVAHRALVESAEARARARRVLGVDDRRQVFAEQLFAAAAGNAAHRLVDAQAAAVAARDRHADRRVLERVAKALLVLAQLALFDALAVGDVDDLLDHTRRDARGI